MKVAFLAGTLGRGGAEKQLIFMLRALLSEGVDVRVLCLTQGEPYEKEIRELGIDIDWIGKSQRRHMRLLAMIGNLRSRPADILHSAHFFTNMYVAVSGRTLGIPNIGAIRSDLTSEVAANGVFGEWQLKLPRRLIVNSELALSRALTLGLSKERIDLVRNVVSAASTNSSEPSAVACRILFSGRLVQEKRPELFIELASHLRDRLPEKRLKFIIAGDGPLREGLEQLADSKGLGSTDITFLGEQADMGNVYRDSDILVLSSRHEGTPNVILEAMAHGIPVIATRVGGVPEVVADGCGILVDPHDAEDLFRAASRLILDRQLRQSIGLEAHKYVKKNHSIGYLQRKLMSIYSGLLKDERAIL